MEIWIVLWIVRNHLEAVTVTEILSAVTSNIVYSNNNVISISGHIVYSDSANKTDSEQFNIVLFNYDSYIETKTA